MTTMTLGSVAQVYNGKTPSKLEHRTCGHPVLKIKDISEVGQFKGQYSGFVDESVAARYRQKWIAAGDTLILNAAHNSDYVASKAYLATDQVAGSLPTGEWTVVRPIATTLLPEYFYFWLRTDHTRKSLKFLVKGIHLYPKDVATLQVPVPPIDEQRRIVELLSRAENIVRMRREAEKKAKEIIPALFLDMFGDPATNPKGWPIEPLAEVAAIESPLRTPDLVTEATDVCIGPDSIESMTGQLLGQPTVGDIRPISGKYRYRYRDVLYSKIRPALVKVALAPRDGYCSADMYPLRCGPKVRPEYLLQILLNQHFTRYALDRATRAQMPKINREALFAYRLPVPPTDIQDAFTRHCQGYGSVREQQRQALGITEQAFQSLLAGVF